MDPVPPPAVIPSASGLLQLKSPMVATINGRREQFTPGTSIALAAGIHTIELSAATTSNTFSMEIALATDHDRGERVEDVPAPELERLLRPRGGRALRDEAAELRCHASHALPA